MASVTGLTADRMRAIEAACVVDGAVMLDDLILTRQDGSTFNAGRVKGDKGDRGIPGINAAPGSVEPTPDTTPVRTSDSRVKTAEPKEANDSVTKLYSDSVRDFARRNVRYQRLLTGGGVRKCSATGVSWSQRFIVIGTGRHVSTPINYFNIDFPPNGTVIPVYGDTSQTSVTVANGEIPLTSWGPLYYEVPEVAQGPSDPSKFRIVRHLADTSPLVIPENWIVVVNVNLDSRSARYMWGDGRVQDHWRGVSLQNGWIAFGGIYASPAWRYLPTGEITMKGLIRSGTSGSATPFWTIAADLAPDEAQLYSQVASASGATARIDLLPSGAMFVNGYSTGASNAYVSLTGIRWFPAGT